MWTVSILSKELIKGNLFIDIEYSNGETTFTETYQSSAIKDPNWLDILIKQRFSEIESLDNFSSSVKLGNVDLADVQIGK